MAYPLADIEGIGPAQQAKFESAGIKSVEQLLEKGSTPKGRKDLETETGIDGKRSFALLITPTCFALTELPDSSQNY